MTDPIDSVVRGSATDAAAAIGSGRVRSRELVEAVLDRIDRINPAVNAVVEVCADQALAAASAADAAVAAVEQTGALHGVPVTIKEAFGVAGMRSTWGAPEFTDHVASRDAVVVERLRRAGAIIVGTTNAAAMLGDFAQTDNEMYGTTCNPWDLTRTAGGSSGGAAAAVSSGMSMLDVGSDLAGSIRIPAGFCGVYGLKPSAGVVSTVGLQPPGAPPDHGDQNYMSAVGPLARSATDLRTALVATAGPVDPAARAWTWRLPQPRHRRLADFRVGVVLDSDLCPITTEVGSILSDVLDAVAAAGATIVPGWPPGLDPRAAGESLRVPGRVVLRSPSARQRELRDPGGGGPAGTVADHRPRSVGRTLHRDRRVRLPDELHPGLPARPAPLRATHHRSRRQAAPLHRPDLLDQPGIAAPSARRRCPDRAHPSRVTRRRPDHHPAENPFERVHYVTAGIEACVRQAKAAAGDRDVMLHGAYTAQECVKAGVLDVIEIQLRPFLLCQGRRLFDNLPPEHIELELVRTLEAPGTLHLRYEVRHP
jgi:amidase